MFKKTKKLSGSKLRPSGRQAEMVMVRGQITPSLQYQEVGPYPKDTGETWNVLKQESMIRFVFHKYPSYCRMGVGYRERWGARGQGGGQETRWERQDVAKVGP